MASQCSICGRDDLTEIESALLRGNTIRVVAERHNVSRAAMGRHSARHFRPRINAEAGNTSAAPVCIPRGGLLAEYFKARNIVELPPAASIRLHLVRDVQRLEGLLDAAISSDNTAAFLSIMRTKWSTLEKSGLTADLSTPLGGVITQDEHDTREVILLKMKRSDAMAQMAGALFDRLAGVVETDSPRIRHRVRQTFAGADTASLAPRTDPPSGTSDATSGVV
jgi:hypothetical protein